MTTFSKSGPGWPEKLGAIGLTLICTGVLTGLAVYFGYPFAAGIVVQVLATAAVFGGVFLYRRAKRTNRNGKNAAVVSCLMVALFLSPAVLNAAEVTTWNRAAAAAEADSEPVSRPCAL